MTALDKSHLPELQSAPKSAASSKTIILTSLGVAVLSLFLFAWFTESVSHEQTKNFDLAVRMRIHKYASPGVTKAMVAISFFGGTGLRLASVLAVAVFLCLRWWRATLWLITSLLGALVLETGMKYAFHRARPVPFFGALPDSYSFPSGHALLSFCFYGVLAALLAGRTRSRLARIIIWTLATLLVTTIGLSRIYLGVHHPSDVIAGYLAAALWISTLISLDSTGIGRRPRKSAV